jgi:hypothetical protein
MNVTVNSGNRPLRRYLRSGLVVSFLVHGLMSSVLLIASWRVLQPPQANMIAAGWGDAEEVAAEPTPEAVSVTIKPQDVTASMVAKKLDEEIQSSKQLSRDEQLSELDVMTNRLNNLSSSESLEALSGTFQAWMGTEARASKPAIAPQTKDFAFDTAQLHDVRRDVDAEGRTQYFAILLDAAGQTTEVEMTAAEGKPAYELMERMKANPLLDQLYRQLAMPLMDQLMKSAAQADSTADRDVESSAKQGGLNDDPFGEPETSETEELVPTP